MDDILGRQLRFEGVCVQIIFLRYD